MSVPKIFFSGFQLMFAPLGYPGFIFGHMQINMYTVPAIVANILVAVSFILMAFFFTEAPMFREGKRASLTSTGTVTHISALSKRTDYLSGIIEWLRVIQPF